MRERDRWGVLPVALALQAQAAAIAGDPETAEAAAAEAQAGRAPFLRVEALWHGLGRAWVADARGESAGARRLLHQAAGECRALGQAALEGLALHHAARMGDATGAPRLAELAAQVDGALLPALARHAAALAARDPAALEGSARELEELGLALDAAEAMAESASAHADAGRAGPSRRAAAESARLARGCEGARTPALAVLAPASSRAGALTRRELEVATLAARGLANEQIAERLVVSVRTVESHLYRSFAKLGIGGREELGPLMLGNPRAPSVP